MDKRDIGLFLVDDCVDLVIENDDLKNDGGLETAILISLFTDQHVDLDEVPFGETSQRGWWGDLFPDIEGDEIGSKLWTLGRRKTTLPTRNKIIELARNSLQWLIEDGVASEVNVDAEIVARDRIDLSIEIIRPNEPNQRFDVVWNAQEQKIEVA